MFLTAPLTLDTTIMCYCVKNVTKCEGAATKLGDDEEALWSKLFDLDKIRRLRNQLTFGFSIATDGVAAMVRFQRPELKQSCRPALVGGERGYHEEKDNYPFNSTANLVAIDPGIRAVVTAVSLSQPQLQPLVMRQQYYKDASLLNYRQHFAKYGRTRRVKLGKGTKRVKNRTNVQTELSVHAQTLKTITTAMGIAPSAKSVLPQTYSAYVSALSTHWNAWWTCKARLKWRKVKFFAWRRREAFLEGFVGRFAKQFGPDPVVLFGNGSNSGAWAKHRGCGVKGPVKELRMRLARKYTVVECSEYRTSKLCLECGGVVKTYQHGVSYCPQQSHHRMLNRDVSAAFKIGALYLAQQQQRPLGPWERNSVLHAEQLPSTVLRDTLSVYQQQFRA